MDNSFVLFIKNIITLIMEMETTIMFLMDSTSVIGNILQNYYKKLPTCTCRCSRILYINYY